MKKLLLPLLILPFLEVGAAESPWLTYDEALRAARTDHRSVLVLYGREGCEYVGPAKTALDAPSVVAVTDGKYARAYVDINKSKDIAKRWHVDGTPTLQFLGPDDEEVWRILPTANPEEVSAAIEEVVGGKSYAREERALRAGTLEPRQTLELARTYLDRGWSRKGESLVRQIVNDPSRFDRQLRREASFYRMEFSTNKQRREQLPRHIAMFPEDVLAKINLGYVTHTDPIEKRRVVMRQIAEALPMSQKPEDTLAGLRLIVQFAVYSDPASAAWALPFAMQRLVLKPTDMDALSECVALAVTADRHEIIADAERVAHDAHVNAEAIISQAMAAGFKQAETIAKLGFAKK